MSAATAVRWTAGAVLALSLSACAGGWRHGAPPGEAPAASAPAAAGAAAGDATRPTASGAVFVWRGGGSSVALAGEFNGWSPTADPMTRQPDGSWTLVKQLGPGRHAYKFVVDGGTWKEDPTARESVDDGMGGKNSLIVVGAATAPAAAGGGAPAGEPAASAAPPRVTSEGVVFTYAGAASTVHLAGDFNGWSATADPMSRGADGVWTVTRKLAAGTYAYKFLVNGSTWKQDPANPEAADDGFGGKNSILTVP